MADRRRFWWLAPGVMILVLLLAPGTVPAKLALLAAGVCPQRANHSHFFAGAQLPLEARMTGIFGGFLAAAAYLWIAGAGSGARLPSRREFSGLVAMVGVMAVDGLNATAYDLGLGALYRPDNALRLATGLLAGIATALLFLPVWNAWTWRRVATGPAIRRPTEAGGLLALGAAIWLSATAGGAWAFYPLALLGVGGLVLVVAMLNLLLVRALSGAGKSMGGLADLAPYGVLSLALAVAELLVLATLRYTLLGGYRP